MTRDPIVAAVCADLQRRSAVGIAKSRSEAKALKETRYFTGAPCCNGHVDQRLTSNGSCSACARARASAQAKLPKHAKRIKATLAKWKAENSEHVRAYGKEWGKKNKLHVARYARTNKDRRAATMAARKTERLKHDTTWAAAYSLRGGVATRSRRLSLPCDPELKTARYMLEWLRRQPSCECCGVEFDHERGGVWKKNAASVDRFVPERGYTKANSRLICLRCNTLKRDGSLQEFRRIVAWMERVA